MKVVQRKTGGAREKTLSITCYRQGYKPKARDFATHATQIERGWSASETTLRVDDISIFDISDVLGRIGSCCLAIYPIHLSLGNCFFALRIKFEDRTD